MNSIIIINPILLSFILTSLSLFPSAINCIEYLENGVAKLSGGDIDVQTCVDNFDIHKDNIIRTQDSRAMGAKYLSEIELDSRLECLRLCCETEHCDVFVYEDKGPGSCYLFECGPPKDFKCKFTHHVNYTSGILGINRHSNSDLEVEIQHEKDLNKLMNPNIQTPQHNETNASVVTNAVKSASVKPTADVTSIYTKDKSTAILDKGSTKCSRNQFECRTSKDCIAIYNACDGVPQCPDGSDEAKELGCPDTSLDAATTMLPSQNGPRMNIVMGSQSLGRLGVHATLGDEKQRNMLNTAQDDYAVAGPLGRQIISPNSIGREGVLQQDYNMNSDRDRDGRQQQLLQLQFPSNAYQQQQQQQLLYPSQQQQQQQDVPLSVAMSRLPQTNWIPHQVPINIPPVINPLSEKSSHIFNHKVNGLQVADGEPQNPRQTFQQQYSLNDLNQREREYQQQALPGSYYSDIYNKPQQNVPQTNANWQRKPTEDVNNNWQQSNEPPVAINPKHDQDMMAHELKHSKEHFEDGTAVQTTVKFTAKAELERDHTKYAVVVDELAETIENIEDGVAQTPGGAVLSLILGLLITCMLAILIGCRLRVVRRRMRRGGGKSYAHDADYLVNGMYL